MPTFEDQVKPWFVTGAYPTQAQFYQMFDWLRWKDEMLSIGDVTGLTDIINALGLPVENYTSQGVPFVYTIPAGYLLEKILLKASVDTTCSCANENTDGITDDIVFDELINAAAGAVWLVEQMAWATDRNIVIYGMPLNAKIYCIKKKIV